MTMTNAEWMIQQGHKFSDLIVRHKGPDEYNSFVVRLNGEKLDEFELGDGQAFCEFALKKWLDSEHKEPILDDVERKYLTAVIRPFRGRVKYICKIESRFRMGMQFIKISTGDNYCDDSITFPLFASGTMYRGMKANKDYTLEELGL